MGEASTTVRRLIALGLLLLAGAAEAQGALRCGSRLVREDMLAAQVLATCGEPAYRDVWAVPGQYAPGYLAPQEEWTYNFGSSQLLRIVRFRNGRVEHIDSEGYGFPVGGPGRCSAGIGIGWSEYRLLARCGEPLTRQADQRLVPLQRQGEPWRDAYGQVALTPVFREEWIYNFGARHLLRVVTLDNGRVSEVRSEGRGFDP